MPAWRATARGEDWDGIDDTTAAPEVDADLGRRSPDAADEWAQDFFDPDPWGDAEPAADGSLHVRRRAARRRRSAAPGARASGRKSRLPKMAEWRNGTGPRT